MKKILLAVALLAALGAAGVALPLPWGGDDVGRGDQALAAARAPGAPSARRDSGSGGCGPLLRTMRKYPDRFVPFLMPPDGDNDPGGFPTVDAGTLAEMLDVYPGLFRGYGEIGLYARQGGAAELPPVV